MTALTTAFEIASAVYLFIAFLAHTNAKIDRQLAPAPVIESDPELDAAWEEFWEMPASELEAPIVEVDEAQPLPLIHVPQTVAYTAESAEPALATLPVRELKKLASSRKIRGYSNLTKVQLVEALTA